MQQLRKNNVATAADYDATRSKYWGVVRQVERLRFAYSLMEIGPRKEKIDAARADVQNAESNVEKAKWKLDNCKIRSPITGTILKKNAEEGNLVNAIAFSGSVSLCELADLSDLEVDLTVQERDIARVFKGQKCKVRAEAYPDRVYDGVVSRLMPIADRSKGAIPVRVKLTVPREEEGVYLKPEMGAIVTFYGTRLHARDFAECRGQAASLPCSSSRDLVTRLINVRQRLAVRLIDIHRYFQRGSERLDVLHGLTLEVPHGEFLALMGPSGSGKTTLLNLIAGLDKPSRGEVWVGDDRISDYPESRLTRWRTRNIGFIFQFYHLLPVLTAYENVELPLLLLPLSARQRRERIATALDIVGLSHRMSHRPGQMSGGEQQRAGIARAIVTDPKLIIADEPTGDLDARSAQEILNLMKELKESLKKSIVMVTHDPRAARQADRMLFLDKGGLVDKPPDSFLLDPHEAIA